MIKRHVIRSRKVNNEITALGNPFEYWNPKVRKDIIDEIETGLYVYFIELDANTEIEIKVITENGEKYLSTDPDYTATNLLLTLPDC